MANHKIEVGKTQRGYQISPDNKKYSHATRFEQKAHESLVCFCLKCGRRNGVFHQTASYFYEIDSTDFSENELFREVYSFYPFNQTFHFHCSKCELTTEHYTVDEHFANIIEKLNSAGIKTRYCCGGHIINENAFEMPYIKFASEDDMKYFNDNHPKLLYFQRDYHKSILRLSPIAPIHYFTDNTYLKDLEVYIDNEILSKMKRKES